MPTFTADDGVNIHYEVAGAGIPLLFAHEFAGDITSWEPQVNFFTRRYRVITYCHRGYPPSDVPEDPEAYSQDRLVADAKGLLDHLGIDQAYMAGLSMGAATALSFAIAHPETTRALVVASTGTGSTRSRSAPGGLEAECRTADGRGYFGFCRRLRKQPDPGAVSAKGPRGMGEIPGGAGGAFRPGFGIDHARNTTSPADGLSA